MFGYVRPLKAELKVREFEQYKAAYCGLCHQLKEDFGFAARFCVNYDLTFLAMLLARKEEAPAYALRRCPAACGLRKKRCCTGGAGLERAAASSVILCWWKLADMGADGGIGEKCKAFLGKLFLRRAYRKAAAALPQFAKTVQEKLEALSRLEQEKCESLDETADLFAQLLQAAAPEEAESARRRVLSELLYHVGRWIYIADAADDLEEDVKKGNYNPLAPRLQAGQPRLDGEEKAWLAATLCHSANLAAAALELLEENAWSGILRNILYLGLPTAAEQVLEGTFRKKDGRQHNTA